MTNLSDQLRAAIDGAGMSRHRLCKLSGVPESSISRFMAGKHTSTATLDRLQKVLRLKVVPERPTRKAKGT